jgi:uncharacterized protein (TIGR03437 family)
MPMAGAAGIFAPRFIELAGAAAEGTIVSIGGAADNPALRQFHADYGAANFDEPVSGSGQFAYDATNILLQAIKGVGLDDKEKLALAIREIEFDGVLGRTTFDANGQTEAAVQIEFLVVKDGEWVPADENVSGRIVTHVSAASLSGTALAANCIATAFGQGLAADVGEAMMTPLPTALGGVSVTVTDSGRVERLAQLLFVSPRQINYIVPSGTAAGPATVAIARAGEVVSTETVQIDAVAPGLFSVDGSGEGVAAALAQKVSPDGLSSFELVFSEAAVGGVVAVPFDVGSGGDRTYLNLYGTGIRGRSGLSAVRATVGGLDMPVLFAGAQGGLVGLDQVNIGPLPAALAGRGVVDVVVTVSGTVANVVTVSVR